MRIEKWHEEGEIFIRMVCVATRLYQLINVISDFSVQSMTANSAVYLLIINDPLMSLI